MAQTRVLVAGSSRPHNEALGAVLDAQQGIELAGVTLSAEETVARLSADGIDLVVAEAGLVEDDGWSQVRAVRNGDTPDVVVLAADVPLADVLEEVRDQQPGADADRGGLTKRELSVLHLLGQALPPKQVAHELGISVHTCRGYVKTILAKLDSHSILEAVLEGQRRGLLAPVPPRAVP